MVTKTDQRKREFKCLEEGFQGTNTQKVRVDRSSFRTLIPKKTNKVPRTTPNAKKEYLIKNFSPKPQKRNCNQTNVTIKLV
jgi:hypothetical protein